MPPAEFVSYLAPVRIPVKQQTGGGATDVDVDGGRLRVAPQPAPREGGDALRGDLGLDLVGGDLRLGVARAGGRAIRPSDCRP